MVKIKKISTPNYNRLLVFLLYLLLTIIITYPTIRNLGTIMYSPKGDALGTTFLFWWFKYLDINNLPLNSDYLLSYPFGAQATSASMPPLYLYGGKILTSLFNEIFAFNVFIFLGIFLSAVGAYYLTYYFTKSETAGFIGGLVFALAPYHITHAYGLNTFTTQWIPFFVLYLFKTRDNLSYKNAIICSLFFSLVALSSYYYAVFMSIVFVCFIIAIIFVKFNELRKTDEPIVPLVTKLKGSIGPYELKVISVSVLFSIAIILSANYALLSSVINSMFANDIASVSGIAAERLQFNILYDFVGHSAHLWDYFIPSYQHPVFGKYVYDFVLNHEFAGFNPEERILYVGFIPLAFTIYALFKKRDFAEHFFVFIALVAFVFASGPFMQYIPVFGIPVPYILVIPMLYAFYKKKTKAGYVLLAASIFASSLPFWLYDLIPFIGIMDNYNILPIPMPAFLIYLTVPMIRVMERFDVIIMLSVSVLSGMGVCHLMNSIKSHKKQILLVSLIALLICFEFTNVPPWRASDVSDVPEVYNWLAGQPDNVVIVEYPFDSIQMFYQRVHQKNMINGFAIETLKLTPSVEYLTNPGVPGMLKQLGATYVVFHEDAYMKRYSASANIIDEMEGLVLIERFGNDSIYEVTAEAEWVEPPVYGANFYPAELRPSARLGRWMINDGEITLINHVSENTPVNIHFSAVSLGIDRTIEVTLNGEKISDLEFPAATRKWEILQNVELIPGNNTLIFHSIQEPVTVDSVVHNGDMRKMSADFTNIVV